MAGGTAIARPGPREGGGTEHEAPRSRDRARGPEAAGGARDGQSLADRRLARLLVAEGLLTQEQLDRALGQHKRGDERLLAAVVRLGLASETDLVQFLARTYRVPVADLVPAAIEPDVLKLVPESLARKYDAVPIERSGTSLTLAMADPTNLPALDDIAFMTGLRVVPAVAPLSVIRQAIADAYPDSSTGMLQRAEAAAELELLDTGSTAGAFDFLELKASADQAPVVRLVNTIVMDSLRMGASDIHLEPAEANLVVRCRVDGVLHEIATLPRRLEPAIVSRIKVMASLDIAERRLPQDGRFKLRDQRREIDFRISILPMIFGEGVCIRILDKESLRLDLTKLGFDPWSLEQFQKAIRAPNGIILITGPTGSGKTTTLYSAMEAVRSPDVNIMTAEDPVEYNLKGINQVQIHDDIGRSFAAVLRSFLRHDPDIILVGEMRDLETAQIAIRAALTGHLVFSTLHTNDAPSSVARLVDMGVPPFLVAASLRLVAAQRLARKVCSACRYAYEAEEASLVPYGHVPQGLGKLTLYDGKGCRACNMTGLKGRIALYEMMPVPEELRERIAENARTSEIRELARQQGSKTLREAGLLKVIEGQTTVKEVLRVTSD